MENEQKCKVLDKEVKELQSRLEYVQRQEQKFNSRLTEEKQK